MRIIFSLILHPIIKVILLSIVTFNGHASMVTTVILDGQLMGFNNIEVSGSQYNVRFKDGTILSVFGEVPAFEFNTLSESHLATTKISQAFEMFSVFDDIDLTLTNGCELIGLCQVWTIFELQPDGRAHAQVFGNQIEDVNDYIVFGTSRLDVDLTPIPQNVYADWQKVSIVPVPATIWLMVPGLFSLIRFSNNKSLSYR